MSHRSDPAHVPSLPRLSIPEFLQGALQQGPTNIVFEHGTNQLGKDLGHLLPVFTSTAVPFALLGGAAVNVHLLTGQCACCSQGNEQVRRFCGHADIGFDGD